MARFAGFALILLALVGGLIAWILFEMGQVEAHPAKAVEFFDVPATCAYIPISFQLNGHGNPDEIRVFNPSPGESYLQFAPAPPITTTETSVAHFMMHDHFTGSVYGDLLGTFHLNNLNGVTVNGSTVGSGKRGFLVNNLIIANQQGSLNLLFAANYTTTAGSPHYPRHLTGYVHSIATTGAYEPYMYTGTFTGTMYPLDQGLIPLYIRVEGKLYTGFEEAESGFLFSGSRELPANKPLTYNVTDVLAQFVRDDITPGASAGNFSAMSVFTGTTQAPITGTFELDNHSLLVGDSLTFSPGWLAGNFRVTNGTGDSFYGPWLTDLPGVAMRGYFFQVGGTGIYANSLIFGEHQGAIAYQGGKDIAGGLAGHYCTELVPQGGATATPAPSATAAPPTSTAQTASATPTATESIPATSTATPGMGATRTATPTACAIRFEDVAEGNVFYAYVMCLACRGIVNGYPCGGPGEPCGATNDPYFRPAGNVTRGQVAKIVAEAAELSDLVSGQTFEDVPPGSTFYVYVERLVDREAMRGYACGNPEPCVPPGNRPYFRPNAGATRGQLAQIVVAAAGIIDPIVGQTFEDVPPGSTFAVPVEMLAGREVISGYACGGASEPCVPPANRPYFRPGNFVTRGQTGKIVANTFLAGCGVSVVGEGLSK